MSRRRVLILLVMERDYRLTGKFRGQSDDPQAPPGFEGGFCTSAEHQPPVLTLAQ
jgi:hypothetical protein